MTFSRFELTIRFFFFVDPYVKTGTILLFCTSRRDIVTHHIKPGQIPENRDVWSPYIKDIGWLVHARF